MPHFPGLDTLRSIAILMVIVFHGGSFHKWQWIKDNGWMGVDLFFVLSGFLIGSQLLRSARIEGRIDFKTFYLKRAFRILPCFLVVLVLYQTWPAFNDVPIKEPTWRYFLFLMNFGWTGGGFSHAWSLCIEEHFYLVFPLIVSICIASKTKLVPILLMALIFFGGIALRAWIWEDMYSFWTQIYRPTYTHLDGLIVGVALALVQQFRPKTWNKLLSYPKENAIIGISLIGFGLLLFGGRKTGLYGTMLMFPFISIGFGTLLLSAVSPKFWLAETKIPGTAMLATGAYTLYLTHKQMMHIAISILGDLKDPKTMLLALILICLASLILHFCVERPFLKLRHLLLHRANH